MTGMGDNLHPVFFFFCLRNRIGAWQVQLKACRGSEHTVPERSGHVADRNRFRSESMTGETK